MSDAVATLMQPPPLGFKPDTPCDEWQGHRDRKGYGRKNVDGRPDLVHRLTWEAAHGPIPDGMCVMHLCDNPPCRRLDHLRLGTVAENNEDMAIKGRHWLGSRTHCKNGHLFTESNTRYDRSKNGRLFRRCLTCVAATQQRQYDATSGAANETCEECGATFPPRRGKTLCSTRCRNRVSARRRTAARREARGTA